MAQSKYFPNLKDKEDIASVEPIENAFSAVEADINLKEDISNKGQAGGYAPLDENGKIIDDYLYASTVKQYGVRWDGTSSTECERLGDAIGLVANAHKGTTDNAQNDFDNIYPWSDMRLCNIDEEGNVLAYIGEPTFAKDGTNGDVMVEIPKFYYKRIKTENVEEIWICGTKYSGYELHPLFLGDDGNKANKVFHSAYNASICTDATNGKIKLQSITGVLPAARISRTQFRTYAKNKGEVWSIEDLSCISALQMLYLVEYANANSQEALGRGLTSLYYGTNFNASVSAENSNTFYTKAEALTYFFDGQQIEIGSSLATNNKAVIPRKITNVEKVGLSEETYAAITFEGDPINIETTDYIWHGCPKNGGCDNLNGKSGYVATLPLQGQADVNYRGIEGIFGKLFRFVDGVNTNNHVLYYSTNRFNFADRVYSNEYKPLSYALSNINGYISSFGYDKTAPWVMLPTEAKGSSTTHIPDFCYQNTGERTLLFGGNWWQADDAGIFTVNYSETPSFSWLYYGAHLLVKK